MSTNARMFFISVLGGAIVSYALVVEVRPALAIMGGLIVLLTTVQSRGT